MASAGRCRRVGSSGVLDGHHDAAIGGFVEVVDHKHPPPGAENETQTVPATVKHRPDPREPLELRQPKTQPISGVPRKAVGAYEGVQILGGCNREFDASHPTTARPA